MFGLHFGRLSRSHVEPSCQSSRCRWFNSVERVTPSNWLCGTRATRPCDRPSFRSTETEALLSGGDQFLGKFLKADYEAALDQH